MGTYKLCMCMKDFSVYTVTRYPVALATFQCQALSVGIISEPEGDPAGVYQAATPVTFTCTHNGSSSATYSWTCSGESNCFTQGWTRPSKRRGILRGGDTGTHTCTVSDGGVTGTVSTSINVSGKLNLSLEIFV